MRYSHVFVAACISGASLASAVPVIHSSTATGLSTATGHTSQLGARSVASSTTLETPSELSDADDLHSTHDSAGDQLNDPEGDTSAAHKPKNSNTRKIRRERERAKREKQMAILKEQTMETRSKAPQSLVVAGERHTVKTKPKPKPQAGAEPQATDPPPPNPNLTRRQRRNLQKGGAKFQATKLWTANGASFVRGIVPVDLRKSHGNLNRNSLMSGTSKLEEVQY